MARNDGQNIQFKWECTTIILNVWNEVNSEIAIN